MTVSTDNRARLALVLLSVCLFASACERLESKPWNVLVLVPDTVRGDHLSLNGYSRETTPVIDALARDGVNFRNTATVAPRTAQSFASILTGLYPTHHGVRFMFDNAVVSDTPNIGSLFGQVGFDSTAISANGFGLLLQDHGFDEF
jgi:arylsulfatase A-like enzyme